MNLYLKMSYKYNGKPGITLHVLNTSLKDLELLTQSTNPR